jgi:hypothetical protein
MSDNIVRQCCADAGPLAAEAEAAQGGTPGGQHMLKPRYRAVDSAGIRWQVRDSALGPSRRSPQSKIVKDSACRCRG